MDGHHPVVVGTEPHIRTEPTSELNLASEPRAMSFNSSFPSLRYGRPWKVHSRQRANSNQRRADDFASDQRCFALSGGVDTRSPSSPPLFLGILLFTSHPLLSPVHGHAMEAGWCSDVLTSALSRLWGINLVSVSWDCAQDNRTISRQPGQGTASPNSKDLQDDIHETSVVSPG